MVRGLGGQRRMRHIPKQPDAKIRRYQNHNIQATSILDAQALLPFDRFTGENHFNEKPTIQPSCRERELPDRKSFWELAASLKETETGDAGRRLEGQSWES